MKVWPPEDILLHRTADALNLDAGQLRGLNPETVLAVSKPPTGNESRRQPVGYVKVVRATPFAAEVTPCAFGQSTATAVAEFPPRSRCHVVSRPLGDMSVKLAIRRPVEGRIHEREDYQDHIAAAVRQLSDDVSPLLHLESNEMHAEWILQTVTPKQFARQFGRTADKPCVLLLSGAGRSRVGRGEESDSIRAARPRFRKVFSHYPADDIRLIAAGLNRDIPKIFAWQNLWRIAHAMRCTNRVEPDLRLIFEVARLEDANDRSGGVPLAEAYLQAGQILECRLDNKSPHDLWVAVFFLDGNLGIELFVSCGLRAGRSLRPLRLRITDDSFGVEGLVALAMPLADSPLQPRFGILEQGPLGVVDEKHPDDNGTRSSLSPIERLLHRATTEMTTRGLHLHPVAANPTVLVHSWVTLPDSGEGER
jgi:hypothetical protein